MKNYQGKIGADPGRGWSSIILGGLAACALAALPAIADDTVGSGGEGPLASGGDETVGTLPIVGGDKGTLEYQRFGRSIRPAVYLEGSVDDLQNVILGAHGDGYIGTEVDPVAGLVRLTFHGNIELTLDRMIFHGGSIAVGLAVPRGFGSGSLAMFDGARAPVRTALRPGLTPIPVLAMESSGMLDAGALQILTAARSGIRTAHRVEAAPDSLVITQRY